MLVLASQSPRRSEILRQAGIPFTVRVADVDESVQAGESAADYVQRLAAAKAHAVEAADAETVLGADTTVVIDGEILAKPADAADARRMLARLSGRRHEVLTGICLRRGGHAIRDCVTTGVVFAALSDREIDEYVASGEPMDKAGAYAIQGLASKFVERIEGDYFNVMGLPVALVYRHLQEAQSPQRRRDAETSAEKTERTTTGCPPKWAPPSADE
jgi:septum formation protein